MRFDGGDQPAAVSGWYDAVLGEHGAGRHAGPGGGRDSSMQAARLLVRQMAPELILGLAVLVLATVQLVYRLQGRELGVWSGALQLGFLVLVGLPLWVLGLKSTLLLHRNEVLRPGLDEATSLRLRLDAWLAEFSPAIAAGAGAVVCPIDDDLDGHPVAASADALVESLRAPGSPQLPVGAPA